MRRVRPRTRRARPSARPSAALAEGAVRSAGSGQPPRPSRAAGSPLGQRCAGQRAAPSASAGSGQTPRPAVRPRALTNLPALPALTPARPACAAALAQKRHGVCAAFARGHALGQVELQLQEHVCSSVSQRCSSAAAQLVRHRVAPVKSWQRGRPSRSATKTTTRELQSPVDSANKKCDPEEAANTKPGRSQRRRVRARRSRAVGAPGPPAAHVRMRSGGPRAHVVCMCVCARRCALQCISFRLLSRAGICTGAQQH